MVIVLFFFKLQGPNILNSATKFIWLISGTASASASTDKYFLDFNMFQMKPFYAFYDFLNMNNK